MSNKESNDVVRRRILRRVSEEEAAMRRGEEASTIDEEEGDPGQPLGVGVPKISIKGMSPETRTPIHMEFDSYVSSWSRLLLLRVDGYKCAEVSLEFLTDVLTQDRLMSKIEIQGAIFDLAKVGVPGLSIDSGFTCCGIQLWVSFPALVMTKERVKEALTQRMKYTKERFMEPDWGPRLSRRAFFS